MDFGILMEWRQDELKPRISKQLSNAAAADFRLATTPQWRHNLSEVKFLSFYNDSKTSRFDNWLKIVRSTFYSRQLKPKMTLWLFNNSTSHGFMCDILKLSGWVFWFFEQKSGQKLYKSNVIFWVDWCKNECLWKMTTCI